MNAPEVPLHPACALFDGFDWSATPLGPRTDWPQALRTAADIVLASPAPMVLIWGPHHILIYNDGYARICGARHPAVFGLGAAQAWPEAWESWNRPVLRQILAGASPTFRDQPLVLERNGAAEDVWLDLFYSPVRGADGAIDGALCTLIETTARVLADRKRAEHNAALEALNRTLAEEREAVRLANEQLRNETGFLRALFEQAPSFMTVLRGPDHVFELYNEPYHRLMGRRDMLGLPAREAIPEAVEQGFIALLDQVYASGEPYVGEQVALTLQGDDGDSVDRILDFVYQPLRDADGQVSGIFVVGIDTTERTQAQEGLRIAQEVGGIGTFEWLPERGVLEASEQYARIWGLPGAGAVTTAELMRLVDPRDIALAGPNRLGIEDNALAYSEYRIRRGDTGELRWLARHGESVRGLNGRVRHLGIVYDITQRKRIEEDLRASQDRLAAIFGQAAVGIAEMALDGRFLRVNDTLCCMLGLPRERLLAMRLPALLDDARAQVVADVAAGGQPGAFEYGYTRPDGVALELLCNLTRLIDVDGRPQALIATVGDVTERRAAEDALRTLNETLEQRVALEVAQRARAEEALYQVQKMEAIGQLTGGVAHDFNNVLQIISSNLQLMQAQAGADPQLHARLRTSIAAVDRGAKLSQQLLAFARRQPLQPIVVDPARLLGSMRDLIRRAVGEAIELEFAVADGAWNTLADPSQLENVLLNLAINARDAMDGRGRLRIAAANVAADALPAGADEAGAGGQYLLLEVADNGCGMPAEVAARAFEPFFTTKPPGVGTGLGLSMAYGFVRQSHGHIVIDSAPGAGTAIRIYLPRSREAAADTVDMADGPVVGGSETILLLEDDAGVHASVLDMLLSLGYRVLRATSGAEALAILHERRDIDLLFTDVVMPGAVRSVDVAEQARNLIPGISVLFTSGYAQDAMAAGGTLAAGVELLSKPYRMEKLARKLRHMLANGRQAAQARRWQAGETGHMKEEKRIWIVQ
jgi:PAS domain S-box-containing protein